MFCYSNTQQTKTSPITQALLLSSIFDNEKTKGCRDNKPLAKGYTASRPQSQGLSPGSLTAQPKPWATLNGDHSLGVSRTCRSWQSASVKLLIYRRGNWGPEERRRGLLSGYTGLGLPDSAVFFTPCCHTMPVTFLALGWYRRVDGRSRLQTCLSNEMQTKVAQAQLTTQLVRTSVWQEPCSPPGRFQPRNQRPWLLKSVLLHTCYHLL